jgi:crotonobetainyl-CoA:carnitine CoA-transferase CaiB-like acyl-CoA transferase
MAAAPLEDRFWANFCEAIALPAALRDDSKDPKATRAAVAEIVCTRTAAQWRQQFDGKDVCCTVVRTLAEAMNDAQFRERGMIRRTVVSEDDALPAISVPIDEAIRASATELRYPRLGEANGMLQKP